MKRLVPILSLLSIPLFACGTGEMDQVSSIEPESVSTFQAGRVKAIHVGGVCSTTFTNSVPASNMGNWGGIESVNAVVDQRTSMAVATANLKDTLDVHCQGNDSCYIFTHSNGGAVISRTLALNATNWNINWIMSSASNEGGSELSSFTGVNGSPLLGCDLTTAIGPTDHRAGWNHNDTHGESFFMAGGNQSMSPFFQSNFLPGADDGAVAYHSAGGLNGVFTVESLCFQDRFHFAGHRGTFDCNGIALDHYQMKNEAICRMGGC